MNRFFSKFMDWGRGTKVQRIFTLEWALAVQGAIKALAQGDHISTENGLSLSKGDGRLRLGHRLTTGSRSKRGGRFLVSLSDGKIYVSVGTCTTVYDSQMGLPSQNAIARPIVPKLEGKTLDSVPAPRFAAVEEGIEYLVVVQAGEGSGKVLLVKPDDEFKQTECERSVAVARFKLKTVSGKLVFDTFKQLYASDILWVISNDDLCSIESSDESSQGSSGSVGSSSSEGDDSLSSTGSDEESNSGSSESSDSSEEDSVAPCPYLTNLQVTPDFGFTCFEERNVPQDINVYVSAVINRVPVGCANRLEVRFTIGSAHGFRSKQVVVGSIAGEVKAYFGEFELFQMRSCNYYQVSAEIIQTSTTGLFDSCDISGCRNLKLTAVYLSPYACPSDDGTCSVDDGLPAGTGHNYISGGTYS